ncbi:MAG: deacylase [Candidatus Omnitrophica bacterium CG11_big_fil_rev_8_21_14_0_20_63_9]|nr:MAG: deacylase [Candidatus Omnitrophica bacterium CG11_big_fil_rev_8_21_14_0_20_63_9]
MAISQKLKAFLDESKAKYTVAKHPVVYTAQEIAAAQHVPGRQLAKSVLVKTDQGIALAVLPAIALIDFKKLKAALNTKSVSIGKEADIRVAFPDVEVGAMSPFGNLYGVPVIVDKTLSQAQDIVFNAGSHTETIKMRYADFTKLVKAKNGNFSQPFPGPKKKTPKKKTPKKKSSTKKKPAKRKKRKKR